MNFRRLTYMLLAATLMCGAAGIASYDAEGATVSAAASAKKKSRKGKKSSGKRKKSRSKRGNASSKKRSGVSRRWSNASAPAPETPSYDSLTLRINTAVLDGIPSNMNPGGLRVNSVKPDKRTQIAKISLNDNFTYLPVTQELIGDLRTTVEKALPDSLKGYGVNLTVGNKSLAYYITKVDKLPEKYRTNIPFVVARDPYVNPKKGMEGDIVALWHSHGRYFKPGSGAWMWQRPLLFETVEDVYTMGYILPYVAPMLENAGAYVMLPRERDINRHEVIVDNDTNEGGELFSQPYYKEMTGDRRWTTGEFDGFIYDLRDFRDTENPFEVGTYRQTTTVRSGKPSVAAWYADIPEAGEYAVYVSYKTLPNSTEDARYTVNYSGGSREFKVNQTMGGSTWIYLGTFPLEAGYDDNRPVVTLTNLSDKASDRVLTADAVKIGGGMGNIARSNRRSDVFYDPSTPETILASAAKEAAADDEEEEDEDNEAVENEGDSVDGEAAAPEETAPTAATAPKGPVPTFRTSGYPRYLEGARYWLHWAGMPEKIYSPYHGSDDYKDDYTARGHWVNHLAGGSRVLPGREGLNIPVDVVMALHSDAGKRSDDSFVGTLGIYYTNGGDSYVDGTPRINSRMLTDMLMRQITGDIRQSYEPRWTRRSMWDKSYVEARVPEVPTSLIELMSHQNFADMQYGLDPNFRFTVGRAIYKALARFVAERKNREVVIQPLPVRDFCIMHTHPSVFRLSWQPTPDSLETTAMPDKYIVFERRQGDLGFHKIGETAKTHFDVKTTDHEIHSFKVVAANEGGLSFPSEVLALRNGEDDKTPVLIINGFDRVAGPEHFSADGRAGFSSETDFGVPYIRDISFTGHQTEFSRSAGERFGRSGSNYADKVIAGNTFDFAALHGEGVAKAGFGFVSCSVGSVVRGEVKPGDYRIVDLILGKQKATVVGNGKSGVRYRTFPAQLRHELEAFVRKGGSLIVSGQYVATDLFGQYAGDDERGFARTVLGIEPSTGDRTRSGRISVTGGAGILDKGGYNYSNTLNEKHYIVDTPDVIDPAEDAKAEVVMQFTDTERPAAIFNRYGKGRVLTMTVPLEALTDAPRREALIEDILIDFDKR